MRTIILIVVIIIAAAVIIYFIKQPNSSTDKTNNQASTCPNSFTVQGGAGLFTTTYSTQSGKFFSQIRGGLAGYSGQLPPKEISQAEFEAACKKSQTPASATA